MSVTNCDDARGVSGLSTRSPYERLLFKLFRFVKGRLKRRYSSALFDLQKGMVAFGPFKGMRLVEQSSWGNDIASMLLGEYEIELQALFEPNEIVLHDVFVDIGCAEGYFAVGVASQSNLPVVAYEISSRSREICRMNAELNSVISRVSLRGEATTRDVSEVLRNYKSPLVLIDIEGSELELLDDNLCHALEGATIIIENHRCAGVDSADEISKRLSSSHTSQHIKKGPRNPFHHTLVAELAEDFAHLMLSEERAGGARWLVLRPHLVDCVGDGQNPKAK